MTRKPVVQEVGCVCGHGQLGLEITVHREGPLEFSSERVVAACRTCGSTDLAAARRSITVPGTPKK